jgi:hypothetical protein
MVICNMLTVAAHFKVGLLTRGVLGVNEGINYKPDSIATVTAEFGPRDFQNTKQGCSTWNQQVRY